MEDEKLLQLPEVRVFAGPNGSGKSTITTPEWILPPYINADEIQLREKCSNIDAAVLAEKMREDAIVHKKSFTFETVMSTTRNLLLLEKAKDCGYFVKGYYILTRSPSINVARVRSRAVTGGHDVPVEKIISRYYKSIALIPRLFLVCDILHVYDNSTELGPVRIIRKHKADVRFYADAFWTKEKLKRLIYD